MLAQKTEARDSALLAQGYIAQSTVDTDRSNAAQDESAVAAAQAAVAQAQAQNLAGNATVSQSASTEQGQAASTQAAQANVDAAAAVVRQDQLNLAHSVITSPVDGTVVARDVSVGQTVAASLQTPTLFSIAQNLGKMEVDINVGEPDIGNVKAGDSVSFSVLAYPNEVFHGTVSQVRINPQTLNNVVTYDVVVFADNTQRQAVARDDGKREHQRRERTERPNGSAGRRCTRPRRRARRGEASPAPRGARRSPPARPLRLDRRSQRKGCSGPG